MNGSQAKETLELEVADFGPIVQARVDLRPFTVFVGPSNTGKSYLAILIYALHRFFSDDPGFMPRHFSRGYWMFRGLERQELSEETITALHELTQKFQDLPEPLDQQDVRLPPPVMDLIRSGFDKGGKELGREIRRCFGMDNVGALIRKGKSKEARILLRRRMSNNATRFEHQWTLAERANKFKTTIPKDIPVRFNTEDTLELRKLLHRMKVSERADKERHHSIWRLKDALSDYVMPYLTGPLHLPAYYLPADRTGVMHAHSVVVSALIASAPTGGLRPAARTPMLSGVLADFLEQLIEVDHPRRPSRKNEQDLGAGIEKAVLRGSVRVRRSTEIKYPRFTYRPKGWKKDLSLMNASSMVSELAPVVLYLRHMVGPENVLIVEEPESHLHPAMQVEFTRQLAALVDAGVRVIVTTHSEWLLEELANIVRRSKLSKAKRGDDVALPPDQVGVWLFDPKRRPKGSVVKEVPLDDSGMYPSGFEEVAAALHNEWADITSQAQGGS